MRTTNRNWRQSFVLALAAAALGFATGFLSGCSPAPLPIAGAVAPAVYTVVASCGRTPCAWFVGTGNGSYSAIFIHPAEAQADVVRNASLFAEAEPDLPPGMVARVEHFVYDVWAPGSDFSISYTAPDGVTLELLLFSATVR